MRNPIKSGSPPALVYQGKYIISILVLVVMFSGVHVAIARTAGIIDEVDDTTGTHSSALSHKSILQSHTKVLAFPQMERFEDYSVRDALLRLPGVQADRRGELNLRGVGHHRYSVSLDGQRLASSDPARRSVDTGILSSDLVRDIELIKVLTPDIDAEALSGVVRVNTWQTAGERALNVRMGGIADPGIFGYTGLGNIGAIQYSEKYRDDFSLAVNLSYHKDNRGYEHLGLIYESENFGDGPVDVIEQVSPGLTLDERGRFNGRIQMTYQPTNRTSFHGYAVILNDDRITDQHRNNRWAGGDWFNPDSTGLVGEQGAYMYNAIMQTSNDRHYLVQLQGRHLLDEVNLDYRMGWTQSDIDQHNYHFSFMRERLNYSINMDDRTRPMMTITNWSLLEDGTLDRRQLTRQPFDRVVDNQLESRFSGRLDMEAPFTLGSVKVGGSAQSTLSDRSYQEMSMLSRPFDMMRFEAIPRGDITVMDTYYIPFLINTRSARVYVNTNKPTMTINEDDMLRRSEIRNYYVTENVYAGYGMASVKLGPLTLLGGVRLEHTDAVYEGRQALFNRFGDGNFDSSEDVEEAATYTDVFPNAQLLLFPLQNSQLRLAYSKGMFRQDYSILAPFLLSNAADTSRFMGNPALKPVYSDNLDLIFDQVLNTTGSLSLGVFYKELSNMAILKEHILIEETFPLLAIPEGETVQVTQYQYMNSENKATVYGVEVSWQQGLDFLPGWLGNLGMFANYTWTHSELENGRNGEATAMLHQSPHVVNTALDYHYGRFSGQVAYHWTAAALFDLTGEPVMAPSLHASQAIYVDRYGDGWKDLSVSTGFRLSNNFRVWGAATNLLRSNRIIYGEDRDLYPYETDYRSGIRMTVGLRYVL